jgi:quercetin dioxygenase-like cupin family protein
MADAPGVEVERSRGATMQVLLGPDDGVPAFVTRCFTLAAGGSIPAHRHASIEHQQVVLEGEMSLRLEDREVTVRAGECVFIPAGVTHAYANRGAAPTRFLCVVPLTDDYEVEWME